MLRLNPRLEINVDRRRQRLHFHWRVSEHESLLLLYFTLHSVLVPVHGYNIRTTEYTDERMNELTYQRINE